MSAPQLARPRTTVRISQSTQRALYVIGLGVWLTGGLWLLFHHFLTRQGEFGPSPNPLEPWWLKLHGAFAFGAVWLFGFLWPVHIRAAWPYRRRRASGSTLVGLLGCLTVSGYLLYYLGDETIRPAISLAHWVLGIAAPAAFVWHRWKKRRPKLQ